MVYNTSLLKAEPAPDLGHAAGRPAVEGQDRHRRRRDGLPAHRHLGGPHLRRRGRAHVARRRSRPTPAATTTRTTRPSPTRSTGARWPSASSTSTTGIASGPRSGAANMHSAIAYFAPHDVGYVLDVSGRRDPEVVAAPGGGAEVRGLPQLGAGAGDHRPQRQLRVPDRIGRDHGTSPRRRSTSSSRTPSPSPSWGPAPRRSSCSKRRSSCDLAVSTLATPARSEVEGPSPHRTSRKAHRSPLLVGLALAVSAVVLLPAASLSCRRASRPRARRPLNEENMAMIIEHVEYRARATDWG